MIPNLTWDLCSYVALKHYENAVDPYIFGQNSTIGLTSVFKFFQLSV